MGREKWDDKSGVRNVGEESGARILRKVWRQMWGEKSGMTKVGREKWGEKVGREKWGAKVGREKLGKVELRNVG